MVNIIMEKNLKINALLLFDYKKKFKAKKDTKEMEI